MTHRRRADHTRPAGAPPDLEWRLCGTTLSTTRPLVAGILNVTPDSFSDGGRWLAPRDAIERAFAMAEEGADLIDIGAESTRPGADPVGAEEEWARLEPVLGGLGELRIPFSVDTTKLDVAQRGVDAGASAINDVSGLRREPALADLAARTGAGLVLMHSRGTPRTMQSDTSYADLIGEVRQELGGALALAVERGCAPDQIVLDPGIGFGKSAEGSLELIARLQELAPLGRPIYVGPSRKSFLGNLFGLEPDERVEGTIAACVAALERGAHIFRVHDVRAVRRALDVAHAVRARAQSEEKIIVAAEAT